MFIINSDIYVYLWIPCIIVGSIFSWSLDILYETTLQRLWSSSYYGSAYILNYPNTLLYYVWTNNFWNIRGTWLEVRIICYSKNSFINKVEFFSSRFFYWYLMLYLLLFVVIVLNPFYIGYYCVSNVRYGKLYVDINCLWY